MSTAKAAAAAGGAVLWAPPHAQQQHEPLAPGSCCFLDLRHLADMSVTPDEAQRLEVALAEERADRARALAARYAPAAAGDHASVQLSNGARMPLVGLGTWCVQGERVCGPAVRCLAGHEGAPQAGLQHGSMQHARTHTHARARARAGRRPRARCSRPC